MTIANQKGLTVSSRKLEANRRNALKSTGPRTERGKAFSRMNSWKHGLFARQIADFESQGENADEYNILLEGLRRQYMPLGHAEELEVERVAQSWWRLKRAYRFENAMNRVAQRNIRRREMAEQHEYCETQEKEERAVVELLRAASEEIKTTGEIPQELKDRVSALMPGSEVLWSGFEMLAKEVLPEAARRKLVPRPTEKRRGAILAQLTSELLARKLEQLAESRSASVWEIAVAQHVIPQSDSLDKLLRYETTTDRYLNRSLERLERMQRQRSGADRPSSTP